MKPIFTLDRAKSKKVLAGYVSDLRHLDQGIVFTKNVKASHYFRQVGGYGMDVSVLEQIKTLGVEFIHINKPETFELWSCPIATWLHFGVTGDYGHGKQSFLPVHKMHYTKTKNDVKLVEVVKDKPLQLTLL